MDRTLRIASVTGIDHSLEVAGPGARSYAFVIDWHIRFLAAAAWYLVTAVIVAGSFDIAAAIDNAAPYTLLVLLPSLAIYFLYHPVLEVVMRGRTPGKRMAGVRILRRDGGVPGALALLVRNVFRLVDSLPLAYVLGLVLTMLTPESVRIGDLAAGTLLVYDDAGDEVLSQISSEAVASLGLERAELVRELLARWRELDPDARTGLGRDVLAKLGRGAVADDAVHAELEALMR